MSLFLFFGLADWGRDLVYLKGDITLRMWLPLAGVVRACVMLPETMLEIPETWLFSVLPVFFDDRGRLGEPPLDKVVWELC